MVKKKKYDASSITVLEGLEGVRKKAGMYIGPTDSRGILHLVKEIIGNSLDECSNGYGSTVAISIQGNVFTVFDSGRGIPVGKVRGSKMDALTAVATKLHAGGKLDAKEGNYTNSIGSHGVGLAVVNALSIKMTIWSFRKNEWYSQEFAKGKIVSEVTRGVKPPKFNNKIWKNGGTIIQWQPDLSCFEKGAKIVTKNILQWIRDTSWFVTSQKGKRSIPIQFHYDVNGKVAIIEAKSLKSYVIKRVSKMNKVEIMEDTFMVDRTEACDFVGAWTTSPDMLFNSACNAVNTVDGGTHYKGAFRAMEDAFKKIAKKTQKFRVTDLMAGFVGCFNVRIPSPQFDSQSKNRLTSPNAEKIAYEAVLDVASRWIRKNKASAQQILDRATAIHDATNDSKLAKQLASALKTKKGGKTMLPPALLVSTTKTADERELYILEGQSAGGTARTASDRRYQEILPLRGKILNVEKSNEKMKDSQAVIDMLQAIGFNPKDMKANLRIGKIMMLADPDNDGSHINALCLAVIWKTMPYMFEQGRVFVVNAPLYIYSTNSEKYFGSSLKDLTSKIKGKLDFSRVTRAKGYGEMRSSDLNEIAFNPATRSLTQVNHPGPKALEIAQAMGTDTSFRRKLLGFD